MMKKIIIRIVIAVLIVGTAAFFILFSKYAEEDEQKYKNSYMSKERLEEDYAFVWDFIENGYPFKNVCIRAGADLEKIKKDYFQKLPGIKDELEYYLFYMSLFSKVRNDKFIGHLDVYNIEYLNSKTDRVQGTIVYDNDSKANGFYQLLLRRVNTALKQNNLEEIFKKYDLKLKPPLNLEFEDILENYFETKIIEDKKIAYLNIKSFYTYNDEFQELYIKKINSILHSLGGYQNVIIDLRENRGGFNTLWQEHIVSHLIKYSLEYYSHLVYNNQNNFFKILEDNFLLVKPLEPNGNFKTVFFSKQNEDDKELFNSIRSYFAEVLPSPPYIDFKKIWVLIGNDTISAADEFAAFAKQTKFAKLIGENTGGGGLNWLPKLYLQLPNCGLLIQSDMLYALNPDWTCNDEFGTAPDIYNLPGKDALETCLEEIRKLGEKTN
ncbi:S41 family peptidase [Treponema denticola]|uniref:S41 family peptidase n=1 Tax=Treponema denticola TaxID=158 RepID=UPI00208DC0EB|nr:S41 family peptidase [Treponema denticola]